MAEVFDTVHLHSWQRVNHFRNQRELCRKDLMVKNLKRFKRELQKEGLVEEADAYSFWPLTYVLPGDYALFVEEFKRNPASLWIMKPVGRSQGKGIFLFQHLRQINKWKSDSRYGAKAGTAKAEGGKEEKDAETYVVQRYIANPYLISGRKFDIRMYALVTSYQPLVCWIHRAGFCRFSGVRYSSAASTIGDSGMHLTNVAVQKKENQNNAGQRGTREKGGGDDGGGGGSGGSENDFGGKWLLRDLKLYLMSRYGTALVDKLFLSIQQTVTRCLLSVQSVMMNDKHCFELYGFDVLFDDGFKVYVIEVNASPSMSGSTEEDSTLKEELLSSAFDVVDLEGRLHGDEVRVGGFDLVHKGGPVPTKEGGTGTYGTMLGCDVPKDVTVERSAERCAAAMEGAGGGAAGGKKGEGRGGDGGGKGQPPPHRPMRGGGGTKK